MWGTVCRDQWGTEDALVACRQLGFTNIGECIIILKIVAIILAIAAKTVFPNLDSPTVIFNSTAAGFGVATGPIMLDDVRCNGDEGTLISCPNSGIGTHNCIHAQDVGLECATRE